ncbi:TetR/AcrR family transcriptional regulator [Nocardioides immobilis]|uniref:TetR/AcrR family transcriptional regulator n=1 Tax=Nocardioides immobilis TaxID=2049295 RepID=A0A417XVF3_9ACTN|nr:TetR/AcrR family transcriptional regulator [Nocardioides immobilis]RHW24484.1 TetR/AcrR family transcriptional regulator [Nocardioides immobilis]
MSSQVSDAPRRGLNARQADTVERLLAAGLEELRAVGHEALTVRNVAQRAGVSPATAYTYLASKNHLFAELFLRHLTTGPSGVSRSSSATKRVQSAARALTERIVEERALAAAVTPALLGTDPDVERLRLRIGGEIFARFESALVDPAEPDQPADPAVLEVLVLTFTGALLQVGVGVITYEELTDRMESCVDVILRGNS